MESEDIPPVICTECRKNKPSIAGQAFTKFTCRECGEEVRHHNTAVPKVCYRCSNKLSTCRRCGRKVCKYCKAPVGKEFCNEEHRELYVVEKI